MKVISVNVGLPRTVIWHGQRVSTGIFKDPVEGRIPLRRLNFDGDRQADLSVHGGTHKAVYAYPIEHYPKWKSELPSLEFPYGAFGENLTVEGLSEDTLFVGDRLRVGSALLQVTQPRLPCYKLGIRFQRDDMTKLFLASWRSGIYFLVEEEGDVAAGDNIEILSRDPHQVNVLDIQRLYLDHGADSALLQRALQVEALPESWKQWLRDKAAGARTIRV
ncbi:MAG TPA: MOSC domain-containing protein [Terriglobales bacterium]|jgi:MOSC domain-containing protein YiiM|nr:MOSC domain-containing protein [Terriglobales bacterium]